MISIKVNVYSFIKSEFIFTFFLLAAGVILSYYGILFLYGWVIFDFHLKDFFIGQVALANGAILLSMGLAFCTVAILFVKHVWLVNKK